MSFVKVYIHAVWATKNRLPILEQSKRQDLFEHMHQNALRKEIFMECVNGHKDHVHCLFRLRNDQTISKSILIGQINNSYLQKNWFGRKNILQLVLANQLLKELGNIYRIKKTITKE